MNASSFDEISCGYEYFVDPLRYATGIEDATFLAHAVLSPRLPLHHPDYGQFCWVLTSVFDVVLAAATYTPNDPWEGVSNIFADRNGLRLAYEGCDLNFAIDTPIYEQAILWVEDLDWSGFDRLRELVQTYYDKETLLLVDLDELAVSRYDLPSSLSRDAVKYSQYLLAKIAG